MTTIARRALLRGTAAIALLSMFACAGAQHSRTELEDANDAFSKAIRWSDLRGLGQRVVPDRQAEFLKLAATNEDSLKVVDYEMQDVQVSADKAIVHSRVAWYREPSVSTKTESMTVLWEQKNGTWLIASIVGGPLPLPPLAPANPR
jgi:hypothetical protein